MAPQDQYQTNNDAGAALRPLLLFELILCVTVGKFEIHQMPANQVAHTIWVLWPLRVWSPAAVECNCNLEQEDPGINQTHVALCVTVKLHHRLKNALDMFTTLTSSVSQPDFDM